MYQPKVARQVDGDIASPHALNDEVAALVAQLNNGLDKENVPLNLIAKGKVALDEFHRIWFSEQATRGAPRTSSATDAAHPGVFVPIPDDSGNAWEQVFTAPADGNVHIVLSGGCDMSASYLPANYACPAIFLDGQLVALEDCRYRMMIGCFEIEVRVPVAAGVHVAQFMWSWAQRELHGITTITFDWTPCQAMIHWLGR